ncbi:unnamed protein product [Camellia sinensis]
MAMMGLLLGNFSTDGLPCYFSILSVQKFNVLPSPKLCQPQRHLHQRGWSVFVSSKRLVAGDALIFLRGENGELRVGVRRAMRQQANIPSSVISSHSMHIGVLATAWHAYMTGTFFTVYYKPRTSPAEFIVPFDQYMESVKSNYSVGMRFKMRFEGEEAPEQRCLLEQLLGLKMLIPKDGHNLNGDASRARWDENSTIPSPERVTPWKIQPTLTTAALNPLPVPRLKRPRSSMVPFSPDSSVLTREGFGYSLLPGQKPEQHQGNWADPRPVLVQQPEAVKPKDGNCRLFGIPLISYHVNTEPAHSHKTTIETDQRNCTKVHKRRIALGRSVDLTKFSNYEELIAKLDQLFEFIGELKARNKNWLIVFTDDEGDMMLVGDDPWPKNKGETKDKYFISNLMKEVIMEVGPKNVVQVITDNAANCKAAGHLIEAQFPHIFWTPCVVHTLNLALKNICAAKNVENNSVAFEECNWISEIVVAETRFASSIVMLKRVKLIKQGLQTMVISDKWSCYRDDDIGKAKFVKDKLLDDFWWDQVNYILSFTAPIYDMIRVCDTDRPSLHLVYDMWDTMIEKVKMVIYKHEGKRLEDESTFYNVVHQILVDRWNKNNTPLHCLAHSLNPRYYSDVWLHEDPSRIPPHRDEEVCLERKKCLKRFFDDPMERTKANLEYAKFSTKEGPFADIDSIGDRCDMDPHSWWVVHGASAPTLQCLALRLLVQPSSSSCAERNWSIYSFIHSMKRNKMTPQRAEDLVFVHSNLRLLSRRTPQYLEGETKLWDIAGDTFDSFDDVGMLEVANLSLDEPEMEVVLFTDDGGANEEKGGDATDDEDVQEIGST